MHCCGNVLMEDLPQWLHHQLFYNTHIISLIVSHWCFQLFMLFIWDVSYISSTLELQYVDILQDEGSTSGLKTKRWTPSDNLWSKKLITVAGAALPQIYSTKAVFRDRLWFTFSVWPLHAFTSFSQLFLLHLLSGIFFLLSSFRLEKLLLFPSSSSFAASYKIHSDWTLLFLS